MDERTLKVAFWWIAAVVVMFLAGMGAAAFAGRDSTADPGCYTGARDGDKCVTVCVDKDRHAVATQVECGVGR